LMERAREDTGISVKKAAMKILANLSADYPQHIAAKDVCLLFLQKLDDDEVQTLATKHLEEILFLPAKFEGKRYKDLQPKEKAEVKTKTTILQQMTLNQFEDEKNPLDKLLTKFLDEEKQKSQISRLESIFQLMVDCLVDFINELGIDKGVIPEEKKVSLNLYLNALGPFSRKAPHLLIDYTESFQKSLEDIDISLGDDVSLVFYKLIIELVAETLNLKHLTQAAADSLTAKLKLIIQRQAQYALDPAIMCTSNLYLKYPNIQPSPAQTFRKYLFELKDLSQQLSKASETVLKQKYRHLFIIGKFWKYLNMDVVCTEPTYSSTLRLLLECAKLTNEFGSRAVAALGDMSINLPQVFKDNQYLNLIDTILKQAEDPRKFRLLQSLTAFFKAEDERIIRSQKIQKKIKEVDIQSQGGHASLNADTGICQAVMSKFNKGIMECVFSSDDKVIYAVMSFLQASVPKGLALPLLFIPGLVALSADPEKEFYEKARALLEGIFHKDESLASVNIKENLISCYRYYKEVLSRPNRNREGKMGPPLSVYFELCAKKGKKNFKILMLRACTNFFDFLIKQDPFKDKYTDYGFYKFLADNLATLKYQFEEEVLFVVSQINHHISHSFVRIQHGLQHLVGTEENTNEKPEWSKDAICKAAVCILKLQKTRDYLLYLYRITEEKCQQYINSELKNKISVNIHPSAPLYDPNYMRDLDDLFDSFTDDALSIIYDQFVSVLGEAGVVDAPIPQQPKPQRKKSATNPPPKLMVNNLSNEISLDSPFSALTPSSFPTPSPMVANPKDKKGKRKIQEVASKKSTKKKVKKVKRNSSEDDNDDSDDDDDDDDESDYSDSDEKKKR